MASHSLNPNNMSPRLRRQSTIREPRSTSNLSTTPMVAPVQLPAATAKTNRLIEELRGRFQAFVVDYGTVLASRASLAPQFMRAFNAYAQDTEGSFVQFCRVLDPKIPADREGYRKHASYQAADYLRRLAVRDTTPKDPVPVDERPATPLVALARLMATVLPLVDVNGQVWAAFVKEMNWNDQQVKRLQHLAASQGAVHLPTRVVQQLRHVA